MNSIELPPICMCSRRLTRGATAARAHHIARWWWGSSSRRAPSSCPRSTRQSSQPHKLHQQSLLLFEVLFVSSDLCDFVLRTWWVRLLCGRPYFLYWCTTDFPWFVLDKTSALPFLTLFRLYLPFSIISTISIIQSIFIFNHPNQATFDITCIHLSNPI